MSLGLTAGGLMLGSQAAGAALLEPGYDNAADVYSMYNAVLATGAPTLWAQGYTGKGVDVALIDSGVAPVQGLVGTDKVVHGPDLSFESQSPYSTVPGGAANYAYNDTYGHGTHMAGIIAGRDVAKSCTSTACGYVGDTSQFLGMAPDARVLSLKVADAMGTVDVTQVIAAVDWVTKHKDDYGLHVRVMNLSYGVPSSNLYTSDALAKAVDAAWKAGIVVVAAVGNEGPAYTQADQGTMDPAYNQEVVAVGAYTTCGTPIDRSNDRIATFSSSASSSNKKNPDVVAPGMHVPSLRVPGAQADKEVVDVKTLTDREGCENATYTYPYPGSPPGTDPANDRFLRGSGSSQASAFVSGAAALLVQRYGINTKPDYIKSMLRNNAKPIANVTRTLQGNGEIDLTGTQSGTQSQSYTVTGGGPLESTRGGWNLYWCGAVDCTDPLAVDSSIFLTGEKDVFGAPVNTTTLASQEAAVPPTAWTSVTNSGDPTQNGEYWNGHLMTGAPTPFAWASDPVLGLVWPGHRWSGNDWSGHTWNGHAWVGHTWNGHRWTWDGLTGHRWTDNSWTGHSWAGHTWSDNAWS